MDVHPDDDDTDDDNNDDDDDTQGGDGTSDSKTACFPAHALVNTIDGELRMDELQVGSFVHDGESFSRVVGFLHKSVDIAPVTYISLNFSNGTALEISAKHRIFLADGYDVFARDVKVGDVMANGQIVERIEFTKHNSLFAPLTESGMVVVNGALASCYSEAPHAISHFVMSMPAVVYGAFASFVGSEHVSVVAAPVAIMSN